MQQRLTFQSRDGGFFSGMLQLAAGLAGSCPSSANSISVSVLILNSVVFVICLSFIRDALRLLLVPLVNVDM